MKPLARLLIPQPFEMLALFAHIRIYTLCRNTHHHNRQKTRWYTVFYASLSRCYVNDKTPCHVRGELNKATQYSVALFLNHFWLVGASQCPLGKWCVFAAEHNATTAYHLSSIYCEQANICCLEYTLQGYICRMYSSIYTNCWLAQGFIPSGALCSTRAHPQTDDICMFWA